MRTVSSCGRDATSRQTIVSSLLLWKRWLKGLDSRFGGVNPQRPEERVSEGRVGGFLLWNLLRAAQLILTCQFKIQGTEGRERKQDLWRLELQLLIPSPADMSHRSRASRLRQHVHCDSCYSRRCRARVEASVSCPFGPCRLRCGALFHLCKEEDHLLLCPNVRVPCLNAGYGCPLQLPRSLQAAHLRACPASVVCCSMEWLRWPTDDTNPNCSVVLHDNVLKESQGRGEALDVAVALVDQSDLFRRLKLAPLYPELMEEAEEEEEEVKEERRAEMAVGGAVSGSADDGFHAPISVENSLCEESAAEETKQSLGKTSSISKDKFSLTEMMFSMERGGCAVAEAGLVDPKQNPKPGEAGPAPGGRGTTGAGAGKEDAAAADTGKTGLAPWQEGVLERLREELSPQEYNMYVVHHGRMLLAFGQIQACTPREKDFVYGSLEPIPVQTLRSFKIPDSYHYRRRVHLYDTAARAQSETRCVDTSDLGADEDEWFSDEASAALLGYAERAVMGHKISVSRAIDGLFNDVAAQTHSFRSAPFTRKTSLADVMADRPLRLRLQLQAESVSSRHNRASCAFSFLCGHSFHRREFATHFRNVHSDIQTCLSGWFEQRCPLSYLGCTYTQRRFQPSTHKATVTYNQQLRTFNLCPTLAPPADGSQPTRSSGGDSLSSLPYEVLCHVAGFLDSFSLSQLALASRLMRQVCSSLLQERGMVTLRWERTSYSGGGAAWRAKPVWAFSHLFSSVDSWRMADIPPISAHLKVCPYYETRLPSEPVPLPSMTEKQGSSQERLSLVNHFKGNT